IALLVGYGLITSFLFSGLLYQITRLGSLKRLATHRTPSASAMSRIHPRNAPALTILVPSYKEEPRVVRQTLLSAVLQQSPTRRRVPLIANPPAPPHRRAAAS